MRRLAPWLAGALVLVLAGACVVQAGSLDREQEALVDRTAEGVTEAMGGAEQFFGYEYERRTSTCLVAQGIEPGRDEDEGWFARKAFDLRADQGPYDYDTMLDAARDHFEDEGYEVQEFVLDGDPGARAVTAVRGEVGVIVRVPPTTVLVSTGPCGPALSVLDEDRWDRVDR